MNRFLSNISHALHRSKFMGQVVKMGLTLAAFLIVFHDVDMSHLHEMYQRQIGEALLLAPWCIVFQIILGTFRWRLIMAALSEQGQHVIDRWTCFRYYYISVFFNNCLPGTVGGDVIRVWLAKSHNIPMTLAIHSVVVDRIIALVALCVMVMVTLPWLGAVLGFNGVWPAPMLAGAVAAGLWLVMHLDKIFGGWDHIAPIRWLLYFASSIRLLLSRWRASLVSLFYAIISHSAWCLCGWLLARSLGSNISVLQCLTLIPPVILVTTLPVSIGGWGMREAGMVGMLGLVGVSKAAALMISIQIGLISILVSLPAGVLWLFSKPQHKMVEP